MEQLRAGVHYPRSTGEFQAWFRTDEDCLDYLEWLRWPGGFICPRCGHGTGWRLGDGRLECAGCSSRTSVTAGTIFDRTRTPLTVWFTACWLFATQKDGISALSLQRSLEIGSYQTAWAMLGRLRSVLVRPGRDRLAGTVEVDETYIGGDGRGCAAAGPRARRCSPASQWRSGSRRGSAGAAWRCWPTGPPPRCIPSSPATSGRARRSSPICQPLLHSARRAVVVLGSTPYPHRTCRQRPFHCGGRPALNAVWNSA